MGLHRAGLIASALMLWATVAHATTGRELPMNSSLFTDQGAAMASPPSGKHRCYTKSDGPYCVDPSGVETKVGGAGSGGVNFISQSTTWKVTTTDDRDLNNSVGNWLAFANTVAGPLPDNGMTGGSPTVTCTRTTSNPLDGAGSLLITKGASNRQGDGCSVVFNVQPAYQGQNVTVTFPLTVVSGSVVQGDVKLFVYDVTNSILITPFNNDVIAGPSIAATFPTTARAATPANQQYRLGIFFASTSTTAVTLEADDFVVTPGVAAYGLNGSNVQSDLTWTPSAGFGTVSQADYRYSQTGSRMQFHLYFKTGTVAASTASIAMPSGKAIDSTGYSSTTNVHVVGIWRQIATGANGNIGGSGSGPLFYDGSDTSNLYLAYQVGANQWTKMTNASTIFTSGDGVEIDTLGPGIPIAGWSSNVQIASSAIFNISTYLANGTRVTGSAPTALGQYRSYLRNAAANTYTETNGSPTTSPTAPDGIKIYTAGTLASADTNNQPSKYDIFVGAHKQVKLRAWSSAGNTGQVDVTPSSQGASGAVTAVGLYSMYDDTTGVLSVFQNASGPGSTITLKMGADPGGAFLAGPIYFDAVVSTNPLFVGADLKPVISNNNNERIERATVTNGGSCAVATQSGNWLSVSHTATGECTLTFTGFSGAPSCSLAGTSGNGFWAGKFNADPTSSGVVVHTTNTGGVASDIGFNIICMGPH